jgi:hypothetical protein
VAQKNFLQRQVKKEGSTEAPHIEELTPGAGNRARTDDLLITNP